MADIPLSCIVVARKGELMGIDKIAELNPPRSNGEVYSHYGKKDKKWRAPDPTIDEIDV